MCSSTLYHPAFRVARVPPSVVTPICALFSMGDRLGRLLRFVEWPSYVMYPDHSVAVMEKQKGRIWRGVNYWEIIANNLKKRGWSWGCVFSLDSAGRTIWITDAHRDSGKRFVVRADDILTAFLEASLKLPACLCASITLSAES